MPASMATFAAPLQRCILGTAQFGLAYGIANRSGQPDLDRTIAILSRAAALGIDTLDTAAAYGQAETRLGLLPAGLAKAFRIITKASIGAVDAIGPADLDRLRSSVRRSCDRLKRDALDGLLIHDAAMLYRPGAERIGEALESLRQDKLVAAIGVSVYTAADITRTLSLLAPDLIQAPANVLDQRLFIDGAISTLESRGVEIHLRSLFLQGLLLMAPEQLPPHLAPLAQIPLTRVHDLAQRLDASILEVCLAFGLAHLGSGRMVLGVSSLEELEDIARAIPAAARLSQLDWSGLADHTTDLLDPSRWPLLARKGEAAS